METASPASPLTFPMRRIDGSFQTCSTQDIKPLRLGLQLKERCILVEYEVPGGSLAHHLIDLKKDLESLKPLDVDSLMRSARAEHGAWLATVADNQLSSILQRLLQHVKEKAGAAATSALPNASNSTSFSPAARSPQGVGTTTAAATTKSVAVDDDDVQPLEDVSDDESKDGGGRGFAAGFGIARRAEPVRLPAKAMEISGQQDSRPRDPVMTTLSSEDADAIRRLLFGNRAAANNDKALPSEWLQGWCFEPESAKSCPYGLRQAEGGPCGIVAPVQAFLVRHLLKIGVSPLKCDSTTGQSALREALTEVLWMVAQESKTNPRVLCLSMGSTAKGLLKGPYGCQSWEYFSRQDLRKAFDGPLLSSAYFVKNPNDEAERLRNGGVLLLLYSAMATRGVEAVRLDADQPQEAQMIGHHNYCTQEAVNLLLTGVAASNVFDGIKRLGSEEPTGTDQTTLKGIEKQPEVGFLSLFESFKSIEVGGFFKRPKSPVWVLHAESHYSVLFALSLKDGSDGDTEELDVVYYDPLGRQDDEKRITITVNGLETEPDEDDIDDNGMIAKVIRTRWSLLAALDWNGSEPVF